MAICALCAEATLKNLFVLPGFYFSFCIDSLDTGDLLSFCFACCDLYALIYFAFKFVSNLQIGLIGHLGNLKGSRETYKMN